ncbi:MAG: hypothetical protein GY711_15935 [bacterium]|nr:hypothetical protein [bacterium]
MGSIPLLVGVTGHRESALAAGADTLVAEVALELGLDLVAGVPFDVDLGRAEQDATGSN